MSDDNLNKGQFNRLPGKDIDNLTYNTLNISNNTIYNNLSSNKNHYNNKTINDNNYYKENSLKENIYPHSTQNNSNIQNHLKNVNNNNNNDVSNMSLSVNSNNYIDKSNNNIINKSTNMKVVYSQNKNKNMTSLKFPYNGISPPSINSSVIVNSSNNNINNISLSSTHINDKYLSPPNSDENNILKTSFSQATTFSNVIPKIPVPLQSYEKHTTSLKIDGEMNKNSDKNTISDIDSYYCTNQKEDCINSKVESSSKNVYYNGEPYNKSESIQNVVKSNSYSKSSVNNLSIYGNTSNDNSYNINSIINIMDNYSIDHSISYSNIDRNNNSMDHNNEDYNSRDHDTRENISMDQYNMSSLSSYYPLPYINYLNTDVETKKEISNGNKNPFLSDVKINDTPQSNHKNSKNSLKDSMLMNDNKTNTTSLPLQVSQGNSEYLSLAVSNNNDYLLEGDTSKPSYNNDNYYHYDYFTDNNENTFNNYKNYEVGYDNKNNQTENIELNTQQINGDNSNYILPNYYFDDDVMINSEDEKKPLKEILHSKNKAFKIKDNSSTSSSLSRLNSLFKNSSFNLSKSYSKNQYNVISEPPPEDSHDENISKNIEVNEKSKNHQSINQHNDENSFQSGKYYTLLDKDDVENKRGLKKKSSLSIDLNYDNVPLSITKEKKIKDNFEEQKESLLSNENAINYEQNTIDNNTSSRDNNENKLKNNEDNKDLYYNVGETNLLNEIDPYSIDLNDARLYTQFNSRLSLGSNNNFIDLSKVPKMDDEKELERLKQIKNKNKRKKKELRKMNKKQRSDTLLRILWIFVCRCMTILVPGFILSFFRLHERAQPLWREKITIFFLFIIISFSFFFLLNYGLMFTSLDPFHHDRVVIHGYQYRLKDLSMNNIQFTDAKPGDDLSAYFPSYTLLMDLENNAELNHLIYDKEKLTNYLSVRTDPTYIANLNITSLKCPGLPSANYNCYDYNLLKPIKRYGNYY